MDEEQSVMVDVEKIEVVAVDESDLNDYQGEDGGGVLSDASMKRLRKYLKGDNQCH